MAPDGASAVAMHFLQCCACRSTPTTAIWRDYLANRLPSWRRARTIVRVRPEVIDDEHERADEVSSEGEVSGDEQVRTQPPSPPPHNELDSADSGSELEPEPEQRYVPQPLAPPSLAPTASATAAAAVTAHEVSSVLLVSRGMQ